MRWVKKLYQTLLLKLQLLTRRSHRHFRDAERQRLRPEALAWLLQLRQSSVLRGCTVAVTVHMWTTFSGAILAIASCKLVQFRLQTLASNFREAYSEILAEVYSTWYLKSYILFKDIFTIVYAANIYLYTIYTSIGYYSGVFNGCERRNLILILCRQGLEWILF